MLLPRALLSLALLAAAVASQEAAGAVGRRALAPLRRPQCAPAFADLMMPNKAKRRVQLPACANATAPAAARPTAAAAAVGTAAAAALSSAYPCAVGDAACFCKWKGALGYFADNDPAVACRQVGAAGPGRRGGAAAACRHCRRRCLLAPPPPL